MLYQNVKIFGANLPVVDATILGVTSFAGFWLLSGLTATPLPTLSEQAAVVAVLMLSFLTLSARMNRYRVRRTEKLFPELVELAEVVFYSNAVTALICAATIAAFEIRLFLPMATLNIAGILLFRTLARLAIRYWRARGKDYRIWLLVGSGRKSQSLKDMIDQNPRFGIRILDVVDLPQTADEAIGAGSTPLGRVQGIRQILAANVVDEVVVTLPQHQYHAEIQALIEICTEAGVSIALPENAFEFEASNSERIQVGDVSLVTHFTGPSNYSQLALKRLLDVAGAVFGLVLLAPFFLVIGLCIRLDSKGPAIYWASRIGLHGRPIKIAKFRTMIQGADRLREELRPLAENTLAFKIKDDPRITRVGKFLRQYHIDELPQIWNVLLGEMSLVGPRPLPPDEAAGEQWWHRRRLSMLPGMTCYWQVTGDHRMPFGEWARLDLMYIDNWSIWLDLKLIFRSIPVIFRKQGW